MAKPTAFDKYFAEPHHFTGDIYVVDGAYSREDAAAMITEAADEVVMPGDLKEDRVRFGFPGGFVEDWDHADGPIWYTGATGKGSKAVWVLGGNHGPSDTHHDQLAGPGQDRRHPRRPRHRLPRH